METNAEQRKYKGPKRGAKWKRNWKEQPHKRARKSLTNEFIASVLRRCHGSIYLALRIIRRESRTIVSLPQLQHIIECSSDFKALMDESYNQLGISALEALADAVEAREEWAIKQVLNSPRAAQLQLGQPSAKINVDARSVSIGGAKVLDDIDLEQRLKRLGDALRNPAISAPIAAAIAAPEALPCPALPCHDLAAPMDAAEALPEALPEAVPDAAPLPAPGTPLQAAQGAPFSPDSPMSHNRRYVSQAPITEPKSAMETGPEAVAIAAPEAGADAGAEAPRKNGRSHRSPRVAKVAAESGAPRKRGRPRGSRDSGRKRGRDPGRGKNRATGGGL